MKFVLDGARSALFIGLVLTLWSFLRVGDAMQEASDAVGGLYVAVAFGMLTALAMAWGVGLGGGIGLWARFLTRGPGAKIREALEEPATDRFVAAAILTVPVLAGIVGAVVAGAHLFVTSKFVRVQFQAAALLLVAAGGVAGAAAISPLIVGAINRITAILPRPQGRSASATTLVGVACIAALGSVVGYFYASSLDVFEGALLKMGLVIGLGVPLGMWLMRRKPVELVVWTWGLPIAGLLAAGACFFGAAGWSSSSAEMREAVTKQSALVAFEARALQRFADRDGDGFPAAWGGADCDDSNAEIYPGAMETPGNGIDENCSGADAEPPPPADHAGIALVRRAVGAGQSAAKKAAEKLPDPPKNLVLLLIDTLRFDHLGIGGYDRNTSPNIDALAREGVVFSRTYATSPHTPRSIPAIFFSRYASHTEWRGGQYNYPKIRPENLGLFEVLQEKGHLNYGVSSHFYFQEKQGIGQGFASWDNEGFGTIAESNDDIAAPRIWARLEPFIEKLAADAKSPDAKPFSLFVHLFEPHARWIQHEEFKFARKEGGDRRIDAYDSEIAFVDSYVGKIVGKLKETGLYDKSVIVLVSDHGEGFNEHGYFFHGQTLYNEVTHVPLVVRVPGWFHRDVPTPVSIVDIGPTVLDLFDYPVPPQFEGESLEPGMVGEELPVRPIYSELLPYTSWKEHHKAVILGDKKFISVYSAGSEELYDLADDPGEKANRIKDDPETAATMRTLLDRFSQKK